MRKMHVLSSLSSPGISQTLLCPAHRGALSSAASRALPTAVLDFCTWVGDEKIHKSLRPGKFRDESRGSSGMQRCSASPKVPIGKAAAIQSGVCTNHPCAGILGHSSLSVGLQPKGIGAGLEKSASSTSSAALPGWGRRRARNCWLQVFALAGEL